MKKYVYFVSVVIHSSGCWPVFNNLEYSCDSKIINIDQVKAIEEYIKADYKKRAGLDVTPIILNYTFLREE